jgi:hypothetical protein
VGASYGDEPARPKHLNYTSWRLAERTPSTAQVDRLARALGTTLSGMFAEVTGLLMVCNTDASALRYVVAVAGRFITVQSWRPYRMVVA